MAEPAPQRVKRRAAPWSGRKRSLAGALILAAMAGYFAGGFLRFAEEVERLSKPAGAAAADGIVVLTGGAMRIDYAIDLLKDGRGRRLLISGVHPGTTATTLARLTDTDKAWFDCCVDIDYVAADTIGNAEMTGRWASSLGFRDLILVTSDYHMPRSLIEFDRVDTIRSVTPYAVRRDDLWQRDAMPSLSGLKIMLTEYAKLIATRLRGAVGLSNPPMPAPPQLASLDQAE